MAEHAKPSPEVFRRRRLFVAGMALVVVIVIAVGISSLFSNPGSISSNTTTTTLPATSTTTLPVTTTTQDPGTLPQTPTEPPTDNASLQARLAPLWNAIQTNSLTLGESVFFPESAYLQMKTGVLTNPGADYQSRLIAFFALDLVTYHDYIGPQQLSVKLESVNANPQLASWIAPGTCENKVGYWHLPNIRLVYSKNGTQFSVGVASLISWRGVWYVVHLGPNPRPSNIGTVDQPATGPGTPGPGGGC